MKNEFVPYKQALELKQLGFDELCLAKYQKLSEAANYQLQLLQKERNCNRLDTAISTPLYQQTFRWFREKHNLWYFCNRSGSGACSGWEDLGNNEHGFENYDTYEEAELECLKKLIEIVKVV